MSFVQDLGDLTYYSARSSTSTAPSSSAKAEPEAKGAAQKYTNRTGESGLHLGRIIKSAFDSLADHLKDFGSNAPGGSAAVIIMPHYC